MNELNLNLTRMPKMNELNLNLVWVVQDLNLNSLEKGHLGQLLERFEELQL